MFSPSTRFEFYSHLSLPKGAFRATQVSHWILETSFCALALFTTVKVVTRMGSIRRTSRGVGSIFYPVAENGIRGAIKRRSETNIVVTMLPL